MLNVGFLEGFLPGEIGDIARGLTYLSKHQESGELFTSPLQRYSPIVREHIERFWKEILESGRIDVAHKSLETAKAKAIYTALRYNKTPFRKMKLCSTQ